MIIIDSVYILVHEVTLKLVEQPLFPAVFPLKSQTIVSFAGGPWKTNPNVDEMLMGSPCEIHDANLMIVWLKAFC